MKLFHFFLAGVSACATLLLTPAVSHATITAAQGDLILAFRTDDGSKPFNLEIDLGASSAFTTWATSNPGSTISLNYTTGATGYFPNSSGGLAPADLVTVFGSNWNTNTGLLFSIAGTTGAPSNSLFATFALGFTPSRAVSGTQSGPAIKINNVRAPLNGQANVFNNGSTAVGYTPAALVSPQAVGFTDSTDSSYSSQVGDGSYTYFTASTEANVVSSGSAFLNLFRIASGSGPATNLGTLSLSSTGALNFTAAPEPGSVMLLGISAMTLLFRRRRTAVQA